jgi:WD40 repeat protein
MFKKKTAAPFKIVSVFVVVILIAFAEACAPAVAPTPNPTMQFETAVAMVRTVTAQAVPLLTPTVAATQTSTREPTATTTRTPTGTATTTRAPTLIGTPTPVRVLSPNCYPMRGIAFSPDGKMLASLAGGASVMDPICPYQVKIWQVQTGELLHTFDIGGGMDVAFSPDGLTLAASSVHFVKVANPPPSCPTCGRIDPGISLVDVASGNELRFFTTAGPGRTETGTELSVAFSPDGKTMASSTNYVAYSGTYPTIVREEFSGIRFWDVLTGQLIRSLRVGGGRLRFSPDGKTLALGGGAEVVFCDVTTGQVVRKVGEPGDDIRSFAFSPDWKILALGSGNYVVKVLDLNTGLVVHTIAGDKRTPMYQVVDVAFSPNGKVLASAGYYDQMVKLWEPSTGRLINTLMAHDRYVQRVSFSPDGSVLASVGDVNIWLWNMTTLQ